MIYIQQNYDSQNNNFLIGILYKKDDINKQEIQEILKKIKNISTSKNNTDLIGQLDPKNLIKSYQNIFVELLKMIKKYEFEFIYKIIKSDHKKDKEECLTLLLESLKSIIKDFSIFNFQSIKVFDVKRMSNINKKFSISIEITERQHSNGLKIADSLAYLCNHKDKNESYYKIVKSLCKEIK